MFRRLSILSGISIIGVVLNHTGGWGLTVWISWAHRYRPGTQTPNMDMLGTLPFYISEALRILPSFAVPAFLFISGFYIAYASRGWNNGTDWKSIRVRIINLLVPYLIWSVVILVLDYVFGAKYTIVDILLRLFITGVNGALYYVPVLISFYLLSPWIVALAHKNWKSLLVGAVVIQLIPVLFRYIFLIFGYSNILYILLKLTPDQIFFRWALYFPLGLVAGLNLDLFKHWIHQYRRILPVLTVLFYAALCVEAELVFVQTPVHLHLDQNSLFFHLYGTAFILTFLAYDQFVLPYANIIAQIGMNSYGIFLTHLTFMYLFAKMVYHVAPQIMSQQILFQPLIFAVGLGVPLLMMNLMRRIPVISPRYRYLFG